ncbi:hypothetical protein GOV09_02845 [Candidatus Woesearchaeota archaeon]|nr:hypothetical protein [Candidatus Woesearchaeota archaeon]
MQNAKRMVKEASDYVSGFFGVSPLEFEIEHVGKSVANGSFSSGGDTYSWERQDIASIALRGNRNIIKTSDDGLTPLLHEVFHAYHFRNNPPVLEMYEWLRGNGHPRLPYTEETFEFHKRNRIFEIVIEAVQQAFFTYYTCAHYGQVVLDAMICGDKHAEHPAQVLRSALKIIGKLQIPVMAEWDGHLSVEEQQLAWARDRTATEYVGERIGENYDARPHVAMRIDMGERNITVYVDRPAVTLTEMEKRVKDWFKREPIAFAGEIIASYNGDIDLMKQALTYGLKAMIKVNPETR